MNNCLTVLAFQCTRKGELLCITVIRRVRIWHSMLRLLFPYSVFLLFDIINVDEVRFKVNFIRSQIISILQETQMSGVVEHDIGIRLLPLEDCSHLL